MFTNRIAYIMLAFDCKNVPDELVSYIGLLSSTIGLMDTDNFTYPELTNEITVVELRRMQPFTQTVKTLTNIALCLRLRARHCMRK